MPSAASNRMMAWAVPPVADITMVASAVATNRALPRPHPARKPTTAPTLSDEPASAANTMIRTRPESSVRLAPIRLEITPVTSIATPMIAM